MKPHAVRRRATLKRTVLEQLVPSPAFEMLKTRTLLEEDKAVIAALVLGEQVLEMVRAEKLINRREMLDLWDMNHQEEDLEQRAAALKNAQDLEEGLAEQQKLDQESDPAETKDLEKHLKE